MELPPDPEQAFELNGIVFRNRADYLEYREDVADLLFEHQAHALLAPRRSWWRRLLGR